MPTVAVDKEDLYQRLGKVYTTEEFDHLCFEFGIELDDDTTAEVEEAARNGQPTERPQLKIEIPANRYDLLCIEGIARALRVFLQKDKTPAYRLVFPTGGEANLLTATIAPETAQVRPFFACAILRNVKFTPRSYASFIDLQDKLHQNICRRRQLVAIGTHDLDTLKPPFRYEARAPKNIKFMPLNKTKEYTAEELMTSEKHLAKYLPIIRDSPVYPIIYDSQERVLSMPPIINSEHSKITLDTKNIFVDVTATDETKLNIVVNMVATMFSEYAADQYTIEPVRVVYPSGKSVIYPDISSRHTTARVSYINGCTGLSLKAEEIGTLLQRMSLIAHPSPIDPDNLLVEIPCTRPDIFHECDIMEDAAIGYGFNNLPKTFPATGTVAQPLAVSKLSDLVRREWAMAGWVEVLPLILCSHDENFGWLNRVDDNKTAVKLANPKTAEYQVIRTSLLPGLLKTIRENRKHPLPVKIFEASDVAFKDPALERQARNVRHAGAVWCNKTAGFEVVCGLLDRIMAMLEVPRILASDKKAKHGYYLLENEDPTFFPGRAAKILYRLKGNPPFSSSQMSQSPLTDTQHPTGPAFVTSPTGAEATKPSTFDNLKSTLSSVLPSIGSSLPKDLDIGVIGILHPSVLEKFEINFPCSALEFTLEPFMQEITPVWADES
ncbi:phenylalanine--tRNA ligase subunit beta [Tulasnella sp. 330]|nr:phenylalanine--tRNA ligase subunit beta [Tulasnella sp. 330]KAG8881790.1 phenylalanine--tRNA ligase subunit beta [Tulasnella sp. 331]